MTSISEILKRLNKLDKIKGSMVITIEGMIISSEFNMEVDNEKLSAHFSNMGLTITNSLIKIQKEPFSRYIVDSDKWKLCFSNISKSYLIVIADLDIEKVTLNVELFQALNMLKKIERLE